MKTKDTTNWELLLSRRSSSLAIKRFATGTYSTEATMKALAFTDCSGEFRKLVRTNGTSYARRLARKALRYRGILQPTT